MVERSHPLTAALWMFGAIGAFSLMAIAGRAVGTELDTFEIMFYRSLVGIVIVLSLGAFFGKLHEINTQQMGTHFARNISHFAGQNLWFFALNFIPLSQLFAFEFSTPLWVAVLAPFFLKEKLTAMRGFCAFLGFVGILIVARPTSSSFSPEIIAAALCAIGFAGAVIGTKLLTRTQSSTCILFWLVTMQAVFGLIAAGYDGDIKVPGSDVIPWVVVIGLCGLTAHYCITMAMMQAPAIIVAPLDFLRLPLITIIAFFLYNEILEWPVAVGAVIVFGANLLNVINEMRNNERKTA